MSPTISLTGWEKRLAAMVKRGYATKHEIDLASDWPSCAIGEKILAETGVKFDVENNEFGSRWLTVKAEKLGLNFAMYVSWASIDPADERTPAKRMSGIKNATETFLEIKALAKVKLDKPRLWD